MRFFKDAKISIAVVKFVRNVNKRKSVWFIFIPVSKIVRLLNHSCLIVDRKHVFNLRSPDALVAGFTNMSLHTEITLFMIFPSEEGNFLILITMSSKHKHYLPSATFKIPTGI